MSLEYSLDLRDTLKPSEETYERFFDGSDGRAHLVFAVDYAPRLWGLLGRREVGRRLVYREMLRWT